MLHLRNLDNNQSSYISRLIIQTQYLNSKTVYEPAIFSNQWSMNPIDDIEQQKENSWCDNWNDIDPLDFLIQTQIVPRFLFIFIDNWTHFARCLLFKLLPHQNETIFNDCQKYGTLGPHDPNLNVTESSFLGSRYWAVNVWWYQVQCYQ